MNISVIIPTYKNKEMLLTNLKHNLQFLEDCEVIIVNDFPEESLKNDLGSLPIMLVENEKNLGFSGAVNAGIIKATSDYVMLLNNDVKLINSSYTNAVQYFTNKNLFAVTFAQKEQDGSIVGKNKWFWNKGFVQHSKGDNLELGPTAWAECGSCLIDRKKMLELNCLDELYRPFYWEDIDLSYRAWKAGYEVLFDPAILVEHHHESTTGKYFMPDHIKTIAYRNQLLFVWKNISDGNLRFNHFLQLPKYLLYYLIKGEMTFIKGFFQALGKISEIDNSNDNLYKLSDQEVLEKFINVKTNN